MNIEGTLILSEFRVSRSEIADQHWVDVSSRAVKRGSLIVDLETVLRVTQFSEYPADVNEHTPFIPRKLQLFVESSGRRVRIKCFLIQADVTIDHSHFMKRERFH